MARSFVRLFFFLVTTIFAMNCALEPAQTSATSDYSMADFLREGASNLYGSSQAALTKGASTIRKESAATYEAVSKSVADWADVARDNAAAYMTTIAYTRTADSDVKKCHPDRVCETSIQ